MPLTIARENGQPVVRLGKTVLFTVTAELARNYDLHRDQLAVQWLNNVRQMLGRPPMTIAQVQTQMYGLDDTGNILDGTASWYGPYFHGRQTANGEIFDQEDLTAAHRTLPLGTFLRVTNRKMVSRWWSESTIADPTLTKKTIGLSICPIGPPRCWGATRRAWCPLRPWSCPRFRVGQRM